jgi:putative MATE family efflux protein
VTLPSASFRDEARRVALLAAPAVAQSLLQTMVFLVDRVMLGRHSETALASMQAAGPLLWSLQSGFGAFGTGTVAVIGRCIGAGDRAGAASALRGSVLISLVVGLLVGAAGVAGVDVILDAMARDAGPEVLAAARSYLVVLLPALPMLFVGMVTTVALQAAGDTRTPLAIAVVTNLVNVVANWALIFGHLGAPRLGVKGAALSNALALTLEAALGVLAVTRAGAPVSLRGGGAVAGARRVLAVAWSAFAERAIFHTGYLVFVRLVNGLGATAMAAHQAMLSVESVSFLTADGFAVAGAARVAQGLGAKDEEAARRAGATAAMMSAALASVFALGFLGAPGLLVQAFRDDAATRAMAVPAMRMAAVAQVPMGVAIVLAQCLRGAGATREAFAVATAGSFAVRIAATTLFVRVMGLGLAGVWAGSACDWVVRAALCVWRWRAGKWAKARV